MQALRQLVEHVGKLVTPTAALLARLGPNLAGCRPEAERTITDGEHRGQHTAPLELPQHGFPAFGAFAITVLDREQILLAVWTDPDYYQSAEPIIIQPDV